MLAPTNNCPYLLLAPMEGVGDYCFRKALASIGGFDEAVRDFIRVPHNAHIKSLASVYNAQEIAPIPLAAQIMGAEAEPMAEMARELMARGALRIDVNCGCPSNTVTGRGAGSSLLKDPDFLYEITSAVVKAVSIPVTIKMRSGFSDISLFNENISAAQASGAAFITLHPRTKVEGYAPKAHWDLIARAKSLLTIPLVGNGDILDANDAEKMLRTTGCDALMIGRGSIINPFIFHHIRAHFAGIFYEPKFEDLQAFLNIFLTETEARYPIHLRVNRLKQLLGYLFKAKLFLIEKRQQILRTSFTDPYKLLDFATPFLKESWSLI